MKIEIKNVSKTFKKNTVLRGVNMCLESGHIYGFIGRNGSGKTVLLKILAAFYEPTEGEVLFDGVNVILEKSFPPKTRVLIEKPYFLPDLTGYENLEYLASIENTIGKEEIEATLKEVDLFFDKDKKFGEYSLGMKQKLGIAQVLMENPEVLLLDEPFNGVDEKSALKLRKLLKKKKEEGKLIILASHIKEDIETLSDKVYKFDNGVVTEVKKKDYA